MATKVPAISKEDFVSIMSTIKGWHDTSDAMEAALKGASAEASPLRDFFSPEAFFVEGEVLVLKTLTLALNDKEEWIEYWIFELDFGRKWKEGMICSPDGEDIPLQTLDQLYELITG